VIGLGYGVEAGLPRKPFCVTRARLARRCSAQLPTVGLQVIHALGVVALGRARSTRFLGPGYQWPTVLPIFEIFLLEV